MNSDPPSAISRLIDTQRLVSISIDELVGFSHPASALDEQRWITVGENSLGSLMVVVWTERGAVIRLISVRSASAKERKSYEKRI
jgi:uncharacterized DUF497 family protein